MNRQADRAISFTYKQGEKWFSASKLKHCIPNTEFCFFFLLLNNSTFRCIWIHFDPKWNQTRFISIDELYIFLRDNYMVAPSLRRASWWWYLIILGSQMSQNHLPRFATRSIMVIMRRRSLAHAHPHYGNGHYLINCIFQMQTDAFPCCFVLFSLWRRFIGRRRQYASDWFFCG